MDLISSFFTQPTAQGAPLSQTPQALSGGNGIFGAGGAQGFLTLLLGQISPVSSSADDQTGQEQPQDAVLTLKNLVESLDNIEIGENGEIIISKTDDESYTAPLNVLPSEPETPNTLFDKPAPALKEIPASAIPSPVKDKLQDIVPEQGHDPAVVNILEQLKKKTAANPALIRDIENAIQEAINAETPLKTPLQDLLEPLTSGDIQNLDIESQDHQLSYQKLNVILEQLVNGIPKESRYDLVISVPKQKQASEIIQNLIIENKDAENPALIATGLTPKDITAFFEKLNENLEQGESVFIGIVKLLPPQSDRKVVFLPRGIVVSRNTGTEANKSNTPNPLLGDVSPDKKSADFTATPAQNNTRTEQPLFGNISPLTSGETDITTPQNGYGDAEFEQVLKVLESGSAKNTNGETPVLEKIADTAKKVSAGLSTILKNFVPAQHNIFSAETWNNIYPEGMEWVTPGVSASGNNTITMATMTSLVNQAQQAATPHPATQTVAATVTKAAQGDGKTINIQLNPPDLGKVQIRMEFGHDKTVKAIISAEKPETYMMLQRDAHVLERALEDAGLDSGNSSLDFELDQDGNLFDQDGRGGRDDSGAGGNASGENEDGDIEIIESTMTWAVDPETGHTRYSLWA